MREKFNPAEMDGDVAVNKKLGGSTEGKHFLRERRLCTSILEMTEREKDSG